MATTTYGSSYVQSTDLVANYPATSLLVANSIDSAGYYIGRGINSQVASYTAVLTDAGKTITMTAAGANTVTIPANASVAFVVGTRINILNLGAGACTPTAGAGVTINGTITALATNGSASVIKTATNTWSYIAAGMPPTSGAAVVTTQQTTTSTSYTDLATAGPAVTISTGTKALVAIQNYMYVASGTTDIFMSFGITGATTVAANDAQSYAIGSSGVNLPALGGAAVFLITGLTAGSNIFTAKYRVSASTGTFRNRNIAVVDMGS